MKKLTLSVLALVFMSSLSFSQLKEVDNGQIPNEEQVPKSRMEQYDAFLDGEYRFPAKPRNMWALGIEGGYDQISGDVDPETGWDIGLNFRKALGYAMSIRFGANYMQPKGRDAAGSQSYLYPGTLKAARSTFNPRGQVWRYDHTFTSTAILPYVEGVLNLNNINFHREQVKWNFELSGGPAAYMFETLTTFADLNNNVSGNVGSVNDVNLGTSRTTREPLEFGDYNVIPAATFSANIGYRASERFALSLRPRYVVTWDDWLDGEAYDDTGIGVANTDYSPDKDRNFALNLGLDFALGNGDKRVQPLWWENPLNFSYAYLKDQYEFDSDGLFEDSDNDGVMDRLDKEPDSPCSFVDGGGVAIDSDKDGIIDCEDACPFTPAAQISEIDENGCTEDIDINCCDEIRNQPPVVVSPVAPPVRTCSSKSYPSISFSGNSRTISADQNNKIATIASTLGSDPSCSISIQGYSSASRKQAAGISEARARAVRDALIDTYGISPNRIRVMSSTDSGYGDVVNVYSVN